VLVLDLDVAKSPHLKHKHSYDARALGFHDLLYEPTENKERDNRLPLSELNLGDHVD
jgi:hypothetical protein